MSKLSLHLRIFSFLFLLISCSKVDPISNENINIEPDPVKKARDAAAQGGGLFGDINRQKSSNQTVNFATSNVLWRATIKSLDFLPLMSSDYLGGIIIYDWYSDANNPREQIKVTVKFLSNELRSDSIKITAHKKICDSTNKCSNSTLDEKFVDTIKENIIASARSLKIEEAKKEKK